MPALNPLVASVAPISLVKKTTVMNKEIPDKYSSFDRDKLIPIVLTLNEF